MVLGSSPVAVTSPSDFAPVSSKEFLDIQATIECGFTLKRVRDMTRTYNYKNLFEKIKKSSKKHYQNKLEKCKNNLKTTWKAMKEIIGKSKVFRQNLPNNLKINKKSITDKKIIADKFNQFFINLGPNLAAKIPPSNMNIDSYLPHVCTIFAEKSVTEEELKKGIFLTKT